MSNKANQSILIATLTSSFGIFISKLLGLVYLSPLSSMAGEANMSFYSITYTYYGTLLKISGAGIPFAMAALVAKYYAKEDYKTMMIVKKLGTSIIMGLSIVASLGFLVMATPLARQSMGPFASESDIHNLKILFYILIIAVIFVPYLSAIRGYYQGLKRLDLYAGSQALEQFVRVFSIIFLGYVFVNVLKFDRIWAVFMAMSAASIAAIVSIIFFKRMTREDDRRVDELLAAQSTEGLTEKEVFKEILTLGIPYVAVSFLGSASPLINTTFFIPYITKLGMSQESAKIYLGIWQANVNKLQSIPNVLALGFSSGLVPYLSESFEKRDYDNLNKQICQMFDTVLFILVPVIIIFAFFAKDIYFIMYGNRNLEIGASLFAVSNIVTFTDTIAPIFSSIMITLGMRKQSIVALVISFIAKYVSFYPCLYLFGAYGMVYSTFICSLIAIAIYALVLIKSFGINFNLTIRRFVTITLCSFVMVIPAYVIHLIINFAYTSRFIDIAIMCGLGILMLITYYFATVNTSLPQAIFGIEKLSIKSLLKRFRA